MSRKKKQKTDVTPYEDRAQLCPHFGEGKVPGGRLDCAGGSEPAGTLQSEGAAAPGMMGGGCGGCTYQKISYEKQLKIKAAEVENLLKGVYPDFPFEGILPSPSETGYRNKMEFTFGDSCKGGPFSLGLHQKSSYMNIVDIRECILIHPDMNRIRNAVRDYFAALYEKGEVDFRNNKTRTGYLRHLLLRRSESRGDILAGLVTASPERSGLYAGLEEEEILKGLKELLLQLNDSGELEGRITGILHITNDAASDIVQSDRTEILSGSEYLYERVLGLDFKISPFSFFQTNTRGAELLYQKAREYAALAGIRAEKKEADPQMRMPVSESISEEEDPQVFASGAEKDGRKTGVLFDLYSGTGTIAQLMAPAAEQVIGVEIVEEAVEAAKENAARNHVENVSFIAGDVLKVLDSLPKPDAIILDPPREGINPKALGKILSYGVTSIVYVSCKPTSLARDLESFKIAGYDLKRACCVDMFPQTPHVEVATLLERVSNRKADSYVKLNVKMEDYYRIKDRDDVGKDTQE